MSRLERNRLRTFTACAASALALTFLPGCFTAKPESGTLDLTEVPENVAVLLPVPGTSIDFGVRPVASSTDVTWTIANAGPWPATEFEEDPDQPALAAPFSFKGGAFPGTGGTCTTTIEPEATCTIVLTYAPAEAGSFTGSLPLRYVNGVVHAPVPLTLTGSTPASLALSDGPLLDFGASAVGVPVDRLLTLTNSGGTSATLLAEAGADALAAPFGFGGGAFPGTGGSCGATLAAGNSCTLALRFAPAGLGPFTDILTLEYQDGQTLGVANATAARDLQGTGE